MNVERLVDKLECAGEQGGNVEGEFVDGSCEQQETGAEHPTTDGTRS